MTFLHPLEARPKRHFYDATSNVTSPRFEPPTEPDLGPDDGPAGDIAALDAFAAANGISLANVPEPASSSLIAVLAVALLPRRKPTRAKRSPPPSPV
ncbi:MAG: hypothetical protein ABSH08_05350 [Tepidisphaeraceae bacterium]